MPIHSLMLVPILGAGVRALHCNAELAADTQGIFLPPPHQLIIQQELLSSWKKLESDGSLVRAATSRSEVF